MDERRRRRASDGGGSVDRRVPGRLAMFVAARRRAQTSGVRKAQAMRRCDTPRRP
ncbi:hypothetical protein [Rhizobacter sp. LjRoot28]|uniref:hypothetical protein n=1 Tax=Rhizobacter sp. LjRoot28 TaxID=3342309 RepID=UPI003ECDAAAB